MLIPKLVALSGLKLFRLGVVTRATSLIVRLSLLCSCFIAANAQYVPQGPELVVGTVPNPPFTTAVTRVAISGDGNTALLSDLTDNSGTRATAVFVRTNGAWTKQGSNLIANDETGTSSLGSALALSADGNTALVGASSDNGGAGAVFIFTRNNGVWNQQSPKLVGSGAIGAANQGRSASLSANGNTALLGGNNDNNQAGASWIFTRSNNGVWTQQGPKLVGTSASTTAMQGTSVSLSGDGTTAAIGGPGDSSVWIFTSSNGVWNQQGAKLTNSAPGVGVALGTSVSLSNDGNTLAAGDALFDKYTIQGEGTSNIGDAEIFTRSGGVWSLQQGLSIYVFATPQLGGSLAISADGNTLLAGGPVARLFKRAGKSWFQASSAIGPGAAVGLSADGLTTIEGTGAYGGAEVYQYTASSSGQAYVTSQTLAGSRNNFTGFVGLGFTVGSVPVQVNSLGRICLTGNSQQHLLKLVIANSGTDVPGGSVSWSASGGVVGDYKYVPLASPVTLQANTQYYMLSYETAGGDQWSDYGAVTTTSVAAENGPAYNDGSHYVLVNTLPNYAYGPVNFLYGGGPGSALSVTITSPQNGGTISGAGYPVSITTTGSVSSLQLQVDGSNVGDAVVVASGQSPPANLSFDTTALSNGPHTLTVVVLDGQSQLAVSPAVTISANNSAASTFITAQTPGAIRNNFTGSVGMAFTTGSLPLQITSLGRMFAAGNTGSHYLYLVNASNGATIGNGFAFIPMAGGIPGQYKYVSLSSPVTLQPNTRYYLLSQETAGGDQWYDYGPVSSTNSASVNGPAYSTDGINFQVVSTLPGQTYGPVNFTYQVSNSPLSVTVTSPLNGTTVSGTISVTVSTTGPVTSVHSQLNSSASSYAAFSAPFTTTIDTTAVSDGQYTLQAVASDGHGYDYTSPGISITVKNALPGGSGVFITGQAPGAARNNFTGLVGVAFTVGSTALRVNSLGRIFAPGNTGMHSMSLVDASTGLLVSGGSVLLSMAGGTVGQYQYASLAGNPVILQPNTTYYLVSHETSGGDQWYDYGSVTSTSVAAVAGPVYLDGQSNGPFIVVSTLPTFAYGPVNFTYSPISSSTGTALITSQPQGVRRNNFTGFVGLAFTVGPTPMQVTSLGRTYDPGGTSQTHMVKLVQATNGIDVPGGSVAWSANGSTDARFQYVALASPVTLSANTTYYLLSQETNGGDFWRDYAPVTSTSEASIGGPAYRDTSSAGNTYNVVTTLPNNAYGPVSLLYQ